MWCIKVEMPTTRSVIFNFQITHLFLKKFHVSAIISDSNVYSKCSCFKRQSQTVRLDNWALPPRRSMFLSRIYFRTFTPLTSVKNKLLLYVTKTSCSYINFMTELVILSAIALFKSAKDAHGDSSRIFNKSNLESYSQTHLSRRSHFSKRKCLK